MEKLNILIPIDFSALSEQAFLMADLLQKKMELNIHLLHVIEANDAILPDHPDLKGFHQKEEEAKTYFKELEKFGNHYQKHTRIGLLTDQIRLATKELSIDLVIMSTHGADGFMERISGSEAQHVARFLQVPVITLRPGTSVLKLENILFVADFEMFGKGIQINLIKQLAIAFDSTIHLLQILKEEDEPYVDEIEAQMKFFAEEHGIQKYEMHLYRDKKIASGIRNFNQEADMDLVCIRTHGRRGISHLWFGSIAERLVNHCLKPLLTFHLRTYA
jgi:nucleotide-binding universal stress UspA family protein